MPREGGDLVEGDARIAVVILVVRDIARYRMIAHDHDAHEIDERKTGFKSYLRDTGAGGELLISFTVVAGFCSSLEA